MATSWKRPITLCPLALDVSTIRHRVSSTRSRSSGALRTTRAWTVSPGAQRGRGARRHPTGGQFCPEAFGLRAGQPHQVGDVASLR